jgi:hypothetical protein
MTTVVRLALALLPLAGYFAILGTWYSNRRPKVVSGPADFAMLAVALGGLISFGPAGGLVVNAVFPRPNLSAWLAMASLVALLAMFWANSARSRLVVYHVDGQVLKDAVGRVMELIAGPTTSTVQGFEDTANRRGVTVEIGPLLGYGVVEAYGEEPEALIDRIRSDLMVHLEPATRIRSTFVALCFALAGGTLAILCIAVVMLARAEMHAALPRVGR